MVLAPSPALSVRDRAFLLDLQRQTLRYFLDNQTADGLVFDRQSNFGPTGDADYAVWPQPGWGSSPSRWRALRRSGSCPPRAAARRVAVGLQTVLDRLPHDQGVLPHFVDSDTFAVYGADVCSTVETGWIAAGALWAAAFLNDPLLEALANRLYGRINWCRWAAPNGLLPTAKGRMGEVRLHLGPTQRRNGVPLHFGGRGGERSRPSPSCWQALRKHESETGGLRFWKRRSRPVRFPVRSGSAGPPRPPTAGRRRSMDRRRTGRRGQPPRLPLRRGALSHLPAGSGPVGRRRAGRPAGP